MKLRSFSKTYSKYTLKKAVPMSHKKKPKQKMKKEAPSHEKKEMKMLGKINSLVMRDKK